MKLTVLSVACATLLLPTLASAAPDAKPADSKAVAVAPQPAPASRPASMSKKERKVCKQVGETGSRLGAKAICKTQAQWDAESAAQRSQTESDQRAH